MTTTPEPRFVCPRCHAAYTGDARFCRACGADMQGASALDAARGGQVRQIEKTLTGPTGQGVAPPIEQDRRLYDSKRTWLGRVVDGKFRVIDVVGRGAMGVVYKVEHLRLGKIAAMKVLHHDLEQDPEIISRFELEANAISKLNHPNTVQVFDFGTSHGALYLIMEYVRGQDLSVIFARDKQLQWARLAPLVAQICAALVEAHELGIVHRDIKPENILITRSGGGRDFVKMLDFGLAKLDSAAAGRAPTTYATGQAQIVGTPYFMSPEQIRGDAVDPRSDLYSLGAMMFLLLTGEYLFTGKTAVGVLTKHLTEAPDPPSRRAPEAGISPEVDALVLRCLAKEPHDRWPSAAVLAESAEEVLARSARPGASPSYSFPAPDPDDELDGISAHRLRREDLDSFERGIRRRRVVVWLVTALLLLGGAGAAAWAIGHTTGVRDTEVEGNDDRATANPITLGRPVHGMLGKRRSRTDGDVDVYRLAASTAGATIYTVELTALPNVDLVLTVTDGTGNPIATLDEAPLGGRELMRRRMITGPLLIRVDQAVASGAMPVENVSDSYTLTVTSEAADPAVETEPNGGSADAISIVPTRALRGWLDSRKDIDVLRWDGPDGRFDLAITRGNLPLVWRLQDGQPHSSDSGRVALQHGDRIRLERSDADRAHGEGLPGIDAAWTVVLTPAP